MLGQSFARAWIPLPGGGYRLYQANGTTTGFRHPEWLGSGRLLTTDTQTLLNDVAFAPFGEDYTQSGSYPEIQFTSGSFGQSTIAASGSQGLDDFAFRRYSPSQGRWISPDPAGLAAVDPTDPQTWNRYAYVGNRPLAFVDLLGLSCEDPYDGKPCVVDVTATAPSDDIGASIVQPIWSVLVPLGDQRNLPWMRDWLVLSQSTATIHR